MKNNNSLIVGMGIGQLYKSVAKTLNLKPITVDQDISKSADFTNIGPAIISYENFLVGHICTPNFTHEKIARSIAPFCKIVIIEKPGLKDADSWRNLIQDFPDTRFMMVKNNMWRSNIDALKLQAFRARYVDLLWINKDRVPNPGTWFTTKELAYGGVSRDLMPHLLSMYIALNPDWRKENINGKLKVTNWQLIDLLSTDYGTVNPHGIYDVDDYCQIDFGLKWKLKANWKDDQADRRCIDFYTNDGLIETFELGLCPEEAYANMVQAAMDNLDNDAFWQEQLEQDIWIHEVIGRL
jgi:predicted dehydrogenase